VNEPGIVATAKALAEGFVSPVGIEGVTHPPGLPLESRKVAVGAGFDLKTKIGLEQVGKEGSTKDM
jgi:hypothetical protein